jgi:hypothetical protein
MVLQTQKSGLQTQKPSSYNYRERRNWTYVGNRSTFIEPSRTDSGAYDTTQLLGPSDVIVRGEDIRGR